MLRHALLALTLLGCPPPGEPDPEDTGDTDTGDTDGGCEPGPTDEAGLVMTEAGLVRGERTGDVWAFRGVPFAEPPGRWRAPEPPACSEGVREADAWPPVCAQAHYEGPTDETSEPIGDEDCLYLNVWTPADAAEPLPVMVYIHGGGNQQGSSSEARYGTVMFEGDLLSARGDVVVVSLQYRVGPLGFLVLPGLDDEDGHAGNYGLLDQVRGLEWVRDNIGAFGGDPDNVMVFGESGGAVDTCFLLVSPLAEGLFHRALMQSGACIARARAEREADSAAYAEAIGCSDGDRACLEALPVDAVLAEVEPIFSGGIVSQQWGAQVDGWVLPDEPHAMMRAGEHNHVPFVVGSNADETGFAAAAATPASVRALFAAFAEPERSELLALYPPGDTNAQARQSFVAATTDAQFTCNARRIARDVAAGQDEPVYRYFFDHSMGTAAGRLLGAVHGVELFYVFQTIERVDDFSDGVPAADATVAGIMLDRWTRFAATGTPTGTPAWPAYDDTDPSFVISADPTVERGIRDDRCDVWDRARLR